MLRESRPTPTSVRSTIPRTALAFWFCAMLLVGASFLAKHLLALPAPGANPKLAASLSALRRPGSMGRWASVHVLYSACRCSQNIVAHLLSTERPRGWDELVLWVGPDEPDARLSGHFRVKRVSRAELSNLGIQAVPLLVVLNSEDRLRYVGGYSTHKQGPQIEDLRIFRELQEKSEIAELPVFGCAVSERLKEQLSIIPGL